MRRDAEFYGDREVELIYIAKRLSEAKAVEALLTGKELDYAVETDEYFGGFLFQRTRIGAFFYVAPEAAVNARRTLEESGYRPQRPPG